MEKCKMSNSTIVPVYSRSFTGQNLFEVSLVKDNDPQLPFYKPKYFFFISMTPGAKTDQGGRTFNRSARITLKCDSEKIIALSESLVFWAKGHGNTYGKFSIYADSSKSYNGGSGIKACFASEYNKPNKNGGDPERYVVISFKLDNGKPFGNFWLPSEALAIANILKNMGEKSIELDMMCRQIQVGTVEQVPQTNYKSSSSNKQQPYNNPDFDHNNSINPPPFSETSSTDNSTDQIKNNFANALNENNGIERPAFIEDAPF